MNSAASDGPAREVLLALGANLGDPVGQLRDAVGALGRTIALDAVSSVYRTEPVGYVEQPDFYNLVCRGRTRLRAEEVLGELHRIEATLGRERTFLNAPRLIDIDLLDYDGRVRETPDLHLPHPRMHERGFVLVPLLEIAPEWRHPVLRRTAAELLRGLGAPGRVQPAGRLEEG